MQTTDSDDGTTITCETTGEGEPLVLVHGSTASDTPASRPRRSWPPAVAFLQE